MSQKGPPVNDSNQPRELSEVDYLSVLFSPLIASF